MSIKGMTSNHGMTTITRQEAMKQDSEKDSAVIKISCPFCGEVFTISKVEYSLQDIFQLITYFKAHKCSYCKPEIYREYQGVTVNHEQVLDNGKVVAYTKPSGFKKAKVKSYQEQKGKQSSYRVR